MPFEINKEIAENSTLSNKRWELRGEVLFFSLLSKEIGMANYKTELRAVVFLWKKIHSNKLNYSIHRIHLLESE